MSTTTTYNGWTNYETWLVNVWLANEEGSSRHWDSMAQECWDDADASAYAKFTGREIFTREERAVLALERMLKESIEEDTPDVTGFWSDMINAALSEVNWHELAEGMMSVVDTTEDGPEDDDEDDEDE